MLRFRFHTYKDCVTCDGEGVINYKMRAGFNVSNMEVTMEDDGDKCPECLARSVFEYECYLDSKRQEVDDER